MKSLSRKKLGAKIGIDLDGVLINHSRNTQRVVGELLGEKISLAQCISDFVKNIISAEKLDEIQALLYGEMSLTAPMMRGAREALIRLKKSGAELYIVSRRRNNILGEKWIKKIWPASYRRAMYFLLQNRKKNQRPRKRLV